MILCVPADPAATVTADYQRTEVVRRTRGAGAPAPQKASDAPFSVEEAIRLAVQNSPLVLAARGDVAAAREGVRAAGALANPQVAFTPALTGGVGGGSDNELFIAQPLELGGTRAARRGGADARLRRAGAEATVTLRDTVFSVRAAYYELVRSRDRAALCRDLLQSAEGLDRIAGRQVELGSRPAVEQVQTAIEVTRARQQVTLADADVAAREATLNALLNRAPGASIGPVSLPTGAANVPPLPPFEEVEGQALARRAELAAAAAAADAFRQEARLALAEGRPDVTPQFRATSVTRGVQQSGFGIGLSLPLLDWGGRRGRVRQAEESARAEEARRDAARAQVRREAASALARARAAREVLAAYPEGLLEQSRRLLSASRTGYEAGRTSVIQLVEAQRTFRQIRSDYIDAQVNAALALAELERATGAYPPDAPNDPAGGVAP